MQHPSAQSERPAGWWTPGEDPPQSGGRALNRALLNTTRPVYLLDADGGPGVAQSGTFTTGECLPDGGDGFPVLGYAPPLHPADLGDAAFKEKHRLRYPYVVGAMANGITSVEMVEAAGRAGMIGFFGAAGLGLDRIREAISQFAQRLPDHPYGFNLIHSPSEPDLELGTVELYLKHGIRRISASAFLQMTLPLVYYRVKGIHRTGDGEIVCPNRIIAKVSRIEIAEKFFSPPPEKILSDLVERRMITPGEAELSRTVPMADDLTAEADSGGHTDNRPALTLLPTMMALRDTLADRFEYRRSLCVGLGGGIATPASAAAAFAMGAAYVLTGSVNQACVEAGTSETVRRMLARAVQADVTMAPAADMFEMGVKVQVLKRGTMFAVRAAKLYDFYRRYDRYEGIPEQQRAALEKDCFHGSFREEWERTRDFFAVRDPKQIDRAERDPRHKMALVFRAYLGKSSKWAVTGESGRQMDYQIWCGPAMGAFNQWARGSFLEDPEHRETVTIAMNLLLGAAVTTRAGWLRQQGISLPPDAGRFMPLTLAKIQACLK